MKKIYLLIFGFLILFIAFLIVTFIPKNYSINYTIGKAVITETYKKDLKYYLFQINNNQTIYPFIMNINYKSKRKLISNIKAVTDKNVSCLIIEVNNEKKYICQKDKQLIDYHLLSKEISAKLEIPYVVNKAELIEKKNNISVFNYINKTIALWNYKGFYTLSSNGIDNNVLLSKDNYENSLSYQNNRFLIIPNYDESYYFTKMYLYDSQKKELKVIKSENNISFNSYFLGFYNNEFYLVDRKNSVELKINAEKLTVTNITDKNNMGLLYSNSNWQKISMKKLVSNDYQFKQAKIYNYELINKKLYLNIENNRVLISTCAVDKIVYVDTDNVYYFVGDTLYSFNLSSGEKKLIQNSEWNFNTNNQIFILD